MAPPSPPSTSRVWPRWLERQLDPGAPAFVAGPAAWHNRSGRRWTWLGTPTAGRSVAVDESGLVWPVGATWAVDWWIGAEDRWHLPARETAVRQALVGGEPVVETVVRVPGGDARSRVYVAAGGDGRDTVVLEVEADTAAPFALAWALVPATLDGLGSIGAIAVDGAAVAVDGEPVLWLPGPPGRLALAGPSGWAGPDAAHTVLTGAAELPPEGPAEVSSAEGAATGAFVFPVSHRSTVRARLAPPPAARTRRRRRVPAAAPVDPPAVDTVGRGWSSLVEHAVRLVLPEGPLATALEVQRRHLAVAAAPAPAPVEPGPAAARVLVAAAQAGVASAATDVLDGWFAADSSADRATVPAAATLWALDALVGVGAVTVAERWLSRVAERAERLGRAVSGGAGRDAEDAEMVVWGRAGLRAAAAVLAAGGEADAAGRVAGWLPSDPVPSPAPPPAGGRPRGAGPAALALLEAAGPLAVPVDPTGVTAPLWAALTDGLVAVGDPVSGLSPAATLALAAHSLGTEARAGEEAEQLLGTVLRAMSPTGAWPELVLPATGSGTAGTGHDPLAAAALWELGRALLVRDQAGSATVALAPCWPAQWWGAPLEVHGLPTRVGRVSYAVRWHGHRPALLWEVAPALGPVTVTSPGFDPAWSSTDLQGEALFDVEAPPAAEGGADFS